LLSLYFSILFKLPCSWVHLELQVCFEVEKGSKEDKSGSTTKHKAEEKSSKKVFEADKEGS